MKTIPLALAAALLAAPALAQTPAAAPAAPHAIVALPAAAKLTVTTPAFKDGGDIPFENTQYRGNIFPGLAWSKGPKATKSYAIVMQDTDGVRNGQTILHWTMMNIPASVTKLEAGMSAPPAGAAYGPNIRGPAQPYMGPRTPPGPKHHYHLQVFALDTMLPAEAGANLAALTGAMTGHVLASGEVVGLGQADPNAPPPAPRPAAAPAATPTPK